MPSAFVTGGTGFVGLNLIQELRARHWEVTACHRQSSNLELIRRFAPRLVVADVVDRQQMLSAMPERPDAVFHLAASVNFWQPKNDEQTRINVEGTRNLVEAALERKAQRFIHMSSVAAWGPSDGDVIDETTPSRAPGHGVNYFRTKWLSEQEVQRGIERGLRAVFINPANILGPYDPNTWSRTFALVKQGRLPLAPPGAAPWCHVHEVVRAALAAVEKGGIGERYLLAGTQATYAQLFDIVCELLGQRPLRVAPRWLLLLLAAARDQMSRVTGREPEITPDMARVLASSFEVRSTKAERELGYRSVPFRQMVEDTFEWMRAEHLV
ncbi:MAG TPA: NAD-dependent epimerase/dehydratase family protein [Polyangiaceae bacterium]|nr:NAD-dependent epimerase/dehydratase family protein [Polyangiaceae bacterium]